MSDLLHLGQQVYFKAILVRTEGAYDRKTYSTQKGWKRSENAWQLPHAVIGGEWAPITSGIIVGRRTLQTGRSIWMGEEEGSTWRREGSVPAYLVAWRLDRKHLLVHPEDLTQA